MPRPRPIVGVDNLVIVSSAAVVHWDIVTTHSTVPQKTICVECVEVQPHYLSSRHHYGPLYVFVVAVIFYNICVI